MLRSTVVLIIRALGVCVMLHFLHLFCLLQSDSVLSKTKVCRSTHLFLFTDCHSSSFHFLGTIGMIISICLKMHLATTCTFTMVVMPSYIISFSLTLQFNLRVRHLILNTEIFVLALGKKYLENCRAELI